MKRRYQQAMEWLYLACVVVSGTALVVITLIIPLGVFMRYAMNFPLSWPEPASVIMMVLFSFVGGAAVYRAKVHIAVQALVDAVSAASAAYCSRWPTSAWRRPHCSCSSGASQLCLTTRHQTIAEFPWLSVAIVYLPIPLAGLLTLLFLIERAWIGDPPESSVMYRDQAVEVE